MSGNGLAFIVASNGLRSTPDAEKRNRVTHIEAPPSGFSQKVNVRNIIMLQGGVGHVSAWHCKQRAEGAINPNVTRNILFWTASNTFVQADLCFLGAVLLDLSLQMRYKRLVYEC